MRCRHVVVQRAVDGYLCFAASPLKVSPTNACLADARARHPAVRAVTLVAITRPVSPSLAECELTHLERVPLDVATAVAQHGAYETLLQSLGAAIVRVAAAPEYPDAVFIEDMAVVLDDIAVVTRPGTLVRRGELAAVAPVLAEYRTVIAMEAPATLDGGDVLRVGRVLYVGRSSRSNDEGFCSL